MKSTTSAGVSDRLEIDVTDKRFGATRVLGPLSLDVGRGEIAAIFGPSGCGKTTLLRIAAGLDADFDGRLRLPARHRRAMVFQEPRLLPWRSVIDNLRIAAPQATDADLADLLDDFELAAHRDHYPADLSVGLARRVALARALALRPDILLLDEPFVSLDAPLARALRDRLMQRLAQTSTIVLLVTHDIDEALMLADEVHVLSSRPATLLGRVRMDAPRLSRDDVALNSARARVHALQERAA